MASSDKPGSFEAIIHAERARKKNENLANQIFGRSKSSQNVKKNQKEPRSPSLASRMGVQKRNSMSGTPTQKSQNPFSPPSRPSSTTPSNRNTQARATRLANEIDSGNANITGNSRSNTARPSRNGSSTQTQQGPGLSIKGSAGPFTLHASNFDPGTSEADLESALHGDSFDEAGISCLQSCRLVTTRPHGIFELVFSEKSVADRIVSKFNNMKADGRMLKVEYVKPGSSRHASRSASERNNGLTPTIEAAVSAEAATTVDGDMEIEEVEGVADYAATSSYDHEREAADRDRRDRDRDYRRDDRRDRDDRDSRRDDRERDRDRDRERERHKDHDRSRDYERKDRDRDYDRRESEPQSQSQAQAQSQSQTPQAYNDYSQRPPNQPYGNAFHRGPRGASGYGGYGSGGGRGYGFPRGGYGSRGGGGGGFRGGYSR